MAFQKGKLKTGGRKCGSLNRATYEIQKACRGHGPGMVARLLDLADSRDGHIAIKAVRLLLAYGFGQPREQIDLNKMDNGSRVVFYMPHNERHVQRKIPSESGVLPDVIRP